MCIRDRDFTGVQTLWELLAPRDELDEHEPLYKWLAQVYEASKPGKASEDILWERLGAKTLALVHGHMSNIKVTGTGLEEVIVDPDSIERLRKLAAQGELDIDPERDLLKDPVTLEEVFDTIDARVQRRLKESGGHEVYKTLAEKIERLRKQAAQSASDTIEFLKKNMSAPIEKREGTLFVAVEDPYDLTRCDAIKAMNLSPRHEFLVALKDDIMGYLSLIHI